MKKNGLTLVEVLIVFVIVGIMLFIMTSQYLVEINSRIAINNDLAALEEARLAMHHMQRTLRFAQITGGPACPPQKTFFPASGAVMLSARIEAGHLEAYYDAGAYRYVDYIWYPPTYPVAETRGWLCCRREGDTILIARDIVFFDCAWDGTTNELELSLVAGKGSSRVPLKTRVRVLGG